MHPRIQGGEPERAVAVGRANLHLPNHLLGAGGYLGDKRVVEHAGHARLVISVAERDHLPAPKGKEVRNFRPLSDVTQFAIPVQRLLATMNRNLAASDVLTMDEVLGRNTLEASFDATLLLVFAGLSLLLAAVGLFGVLSYIVAQRTTEIGIRIALGAKRAQILRLTLVDGLRPALFGLLLGLAAGAGSVKLIESMLFGTRPFDPIVFAVVSATLLAVAALACAMPAWRASRLDPMQALRTE